MLSVWGVHLHYKTIMHREYVHSWVLSGMHEKQVTCGHLSDSDKAGEYNKSYP